MKLSQFRQIIKEEVKNALKEAAKEITYVFQLSGLQVDGVNPKKGGNLVKGASRVKLLKELPGNNDGSGKKLPQPVVLQPKDSNVYHLFVYATSDTFKQVITQYVNASTKEFKTLDNMPIVVQIPPSEVENIQKKTNKAFLTQGSWLDDLRIPYDGKQVKYNIDLIQK